MAESGLRAEVSCRMCELCGAIEQLSLCGACQKTWYCSREHQRSHWHQHKAACRSWVSRRGTDGGRTGSRRETGGCHSAEEAEPEDSPADEAARGQGNGSRGAFDQVTSSGARAHTDRSGLSGPLMQDGMSLQSNNNNNPTAGSGPYQEASQFLNSTLYEADSEDGSVFWQASTIQPDYFTSDALSGLLDEVSSTNAEQVAAPNDSQGSVSGAVKDMTIGQFSAEQASSGLPRPQEPQRQEDQKESAVHVKPRPQSSSPSKVPNTCSKESNGANTKMPEKKEETKLVDYVTKCLKDYGMCVVDNFLGGERGDKILKEVIDLSEAGHFKDGQISSSSLPHRQMQKIRGDKITWVEKGTADCAYIGYLIERLDRLMKASNGKLGSREINGRTKAMVACYPGDGTGYMQHVDNPNQDGRCITCIYYLNKNWDVAEHGGLLRIQPSKLPSIAVADIEPKFDRLLFFWSDRRNPHEVQPAYRRRYAITVWYFDAEERRQARKRHEIIQAVAAAKRRVAASEAASDS